MKIKCLHGFFIFEETSVGQASDFISLTGLDLVPWENHFTFSFLENAPSYSIEGKDLLGFTATKTYAGKPWEVFKANGVIYDFNAGILKPISTITQKAPVTVAGNALYSPGLILPGSLTDESLRVMNYAAWYSRQRQRYLYSEVSYV